MADVFVAGDRVVVSKRKNRDKSYMGQAGVFVEYSHPNRFAVIQLDDRTLGPREDGLIFVHADRVTKETPP